MRTIHGNKNSFRLVIHMFSALLIISLLFLPPASHAQATGNGIAYHGGPVLNTVPTSTTTVYLIWYGNWSGDSALTILPNFISSLNQSSYFAINTTYGFTSVGSPHPANISGNVTLGAQAFDSYSQGKSLTDSSLQTVVSNAMSSRGLPVDLNGVYFVLASGDVTETGSNGTFCTNFCGFHDHALFFLTKDIKYSFVGDAYPRCPNNCTAAFFKINTSVSPNGNQGADGMANVIAHELSETVTDPDLNAWYHSSTSGEIGDLCNFNFGPMFTTPNGAQANLTLAGKNYLVQQLWLNDGGGGCTMASSGNPFTYTNARDEFLTCYGIAGRISSNCTDVSDVSDKQACLAISTGTQTGCNSIKDGNLQLACLGIAVAPQSPSSCFDITNPQMKAFCYGAASGNTNTPLNCDNVADVNARALCLGMSLQDPAQCSVIANRNDKQFCLGVSSHDNTNCASITSCPDPNAQASCINSGAVWNWSTCSCSPAVTCDPAQEASCSKNGGTWDPNNCTCTGGCGTKFTCAQVNPIAQGEASTPLPPIELKARIPLDSASPVMRPVGK